MSYPKRVGGVRFMKASGRSVLFSLLLRPDGAVERCGQALMSEAKMQIVDPELPSNSDKLDLENQRSSPEKPLFGLLASPRESSAKD